MMSTTDLSTHRQRLRQLLEQMDTQAFYCAHPDPLIQGTPGEVFRQCGKKSCKCAQNPADRHGPYKVIQCYQNGKPRQVALRKDQTALWQQAKDYQKQVKMLLALKKTAQELANEVDTIIRLRTEKCPP